MPWLHCITGYRSAHGPGCNRIDRAQETDRRRQPCRTTARLDRQSTLFKEPDISASARPHGNGTATNRNGRPCASGCLSRLLRKGRWARFQRPGYRCNCL